jgi:hypothetical protein
LWGDFDFALEHPTPINAVNDRNDKASSDKTADHHFDRYRFPFFHLAQMLNESCSSTVQLKAPDSDLADLHHMRIELREDIWCVSKTAGKRWQEQASDFKAKAEKLSYGKRDGEIDRPFLAPRLSVPCPYLIRKGEHFPK